MMITGGNITGLIEQSGDCLEEEINMSQGNVE